MVRGEEVNFRCGGIKLHGELYVPKESFSPGLVICHGMSRYGFHATRLYYKLAQTACKNGFTSLLFDFRGCGKSEGEFDYGVGEQRDVMCAIDYLASREEVVSDEIFVVGHSLGGAVALYAVRGEPRVRGLVLWATPSNHSYNVKKFIVRTRGLLSYYLFLLASYLDALTGLPSFPHMKVYGIRLRPCHVRKKLMKLNECEAVSTMKNVPLLVVVGDEDRIVDVEEARQVYSSACEPKEFVIIRSANHVFEGKEDEIAEKTVAWLKGLVRRRLNERVR